MEVLLFVVFWVVLALALLGVALLGGRGKGGRPLKRGGRTLWFAGFAGTLAIFGAALPIAASTGAAENSREIAKAGVGRLTPEQEEGRELFAKWCALCHSLDAANAVAEVGPDLDKLRPTKALVLDAIENGRARGNGAMARDLVVGPDAEKVASFVSAAVGHGGE